MKKLLLITVLFLLSNSSFSEDCYKSMIQSPSPFMGNHGEMFKLSDGTIWQVQHEYEYMYEYYPSVIICPSKNIVLIGKTKLSIKAMGGGTGSPNQSGVIESYIVSDFSGLKLGNIYKLSNGQIWEQSEAWMWMWMWVRPKVMIYNDGGVTKMQVENIDHAVMVKRLK